MKQPLVSVIISSYNYSHFLEEAVASVRGQTYGCIECIVVDDCSTDNSHEILQAIEARWPDVIVIRSQYNEGQSASIVKGLSRASGSYILLQDSDDVLLPDCVVSHLAVHYSASLAVGLTCCDSLQIADGILAGGRNGNLSKAFLDIPPTEHLVSSSPLGYLADEGLILPFLPYDLLRYVPRDNLDWPWSTTSCMFFKKPILELICAAGDFRQMRRGSDNYLARVTNFLTGSIIIDKPLVKYRIHGANAFSKRIHIDGITTHDRTNHYCPETLQIFLGDLEDRFETYFNLIDSPSRFIPLFALLNCMERSDESNNGLLRSARLILRKNRDKWMGLTGRELYEDMLIAAESDDPLQIVENHKSDISPKENNINSRKLDELVRIAQKSEMILSSPATESILSSSTIKNVAMEVWFERQRWGLPYKISKWIANRR